jgi:aspartate kinase
MKVTIRGLADEAGMAAQVFSKLAGNKVSVDMIIQNASADGKANISFTFPGSQRDIALQAVDEIAKELKASEVFIDDNIAKVSLVGTGMKSSPGVAARAFKTLADHKINIVMISTSPIRLSVVVDADQVQEAVQCLHTEFGLDSDSIFEETQLSAEEIAAKMNKGR